MFLLRHVFFAGVLLAVVCWPLLEQSPALAGAGAATAPPPAGMAEKDATEATRAAQAKVA